MPSTSLIRSQHAAHHTPMLEYFKQHPCQPEPPSRHPICPHASSRLLTPPSHLRAHPSIHDATARQSEATPPTASLPHNRLSFPNERQITIPHPSPSSESEKRKGTKPPSSGIGSLNQQIPQTVKTIGDENLLASSDVCCLCSRWIRRCWCVCVCDSRSSNSADAKDWIRGSQTSFSQSSGTGRRFFGKGLERARHSRTHALTHSCLDSTREMNPAALGA